MLPEISARRSLLEPRFRYLSPGSEGENCRPLDHMWQIPFIHSVQIALTCNFHIYMKVCRFVLQSGTDTYVLVWWVFNNCACAFQKHWAQGWERSIKWFWCPYCTSWRAWYFSKLTYWKIKNNRSVTTWCPLIKSLSLFLCVHRKQTENKRLWRTKTKSKNNIRVALCQKTAGKNTSHSKNGKILNPLFSQNYSE